MRFLITNNQQKSKDQRKSKDQQESKDQQDSQKYSFKSDQHGTSVKTFLGAISKFRKWYFRVLKQIS